MVGELSAAIVHEIGQPISAVTFNARSAQRLLAEEQPNAEELREIVADILRDTHRAAEVISQLRALLRRDEVKREPLDIGQVVRDTMGSKCVCCSGVSARYDIAMYASVNE